MLRLGICIAVFVTAMNLFAQKIDRSKPPQTAPLNSFRLPPVFETTLENGLRVVLVEDRRFPLVTLRAGFLAGSKFDPEQLPGLSEATGALLTQGTKMRTARQIAEELATIGGSLSASSGPDTLILHGSALAEHTATLVDLLADVILNANFPESEVQIWKNRRKQELIAERSDAAFWAEEKLATAVFGRHPYSRLNPTLESIDSLNRESLVTFRDHYVAPNNAVLILLGALPAPEETFKLLREQLGGWEKKELPSPPAVSFPDPVRKLILVDRPGSVQADIRVGRLAVPRTSPDYFPLLVANTILGGGASSRMFMKIREEKGYAYDAHSVLQPRRDAGLFAAVTQVRNEVVQPAIEAVQMEMEQLGKEDVPAGELGDVKNYLSGTFVMSLETQNGLATQLSTMELMGLPADYLEKYTQRVRAVSPDQIREVSRKYVAPERASIIVVGDASKIAKPLEKFGKFSVEKAE